MPAVTIDHGALRVGDQTVPLLGGEMHYWRLSPPRWREILTACRAHGLDLIGTYIPWHYHETAPRQYDFTGASEPQRDLRGFLELLTELDFWIFLRPGPYIYAEWTNAGVPDRVVNLPRLSQAYRNEAWHWMEAVSEIIKPFLATNGGRVCLVQPDNEMDLFSHWFETECGLDTPGDGFFQQFLTEHYNNDINRLNRAWHTSYSVFAEARAHAQPVDPLEPHARCRAVDYWRFQHWAVKTAVQWHADQYRRLGIDVPLVANFYPGGDVQNWRALRETVDLLGIDWYPRRNFAGSAIEHRTFLDSCRLQQTLSALPFIAEFECGVWHGYHDHVGSPQPDHYRLLACSALLAGIKGFNWYMFVSRDNWYYSPINERGETRGALSRVFRDIHRAFDTCQPATLEKLTDLAVAFDVTHIATDQQLARNTILDALYAADLDYTFVDLNVAPCKQPVMVYAGAAWLDRTQQERLHDYVASGGTLVLFQTPPLRDENQQPCNVLDLAPPDHVLSPLGKRVAVALGDERGITEGAVWTWEDPPGEPIVCEQSAGRQQAVENADRWMTAYIGKRWTCGYRAELGQGQLIVLGVQPSGAIMTALHQWLNLPRHVQNDTPTVQTGLFRRADRFFLMATNLSEAAANARVRLDSPALPSEMLIRDLFTGETATITGRTLVLTVPATSGGIWEIRPA